MGLVETQNQGFQFGPNQGLGCMNHANVKRRQIKEMQQQLNSVCKQHNKDYGAVYVSWNDNSRSHMSAMGSNITDARLKGKDGEDFLVIRPQNFDERIGKVKASEIAVIAGNHRPNGDLSPITLDQYLQQFGKLASHVGESQSESGKRLNGHHFGSDLSLSTNGDVEVGIRFQAVFLPVAADLSGEMTDDYVKEFYPETFNYQTRSADDPKNLILLCTSQGTFPQQDGPGRQGSFLQKHNSKQWRNHYLEATPTRHAVAMGQQETAAERQAALAKGKAVSTVIGTKAMGLGFNRLMTVQVPLRQRPRHQPRALNVQCSGPPPMMGPPTGFYFGAAAAAAPPAPAGFAAFGSPPPPVIGGCWGAAPAPAPASFGACDAFGAAGLGMGGGSGMGGMGGDMSGMPMPMGGMGAAAPPAACQMQSQSVDLLGDLMAAPESAASTPFAAASTPFAAASTPFAAASSPFAAASSPFAAASSPFAAASTPFGAQAFSAGAAGGAQSFGFGSSSMNTMKEMCRSATHNNSTHNQGHAHAKAARVSYGSDAGRMAQLQVRPERDDRCALTVTVQFYFAVPEGRPIELEDIRKAVDVCEQAYNGCAWDGKLMDGGAATAFAKDAGLSPPPTNTAWPPLKPQPAPPAMHDVTTFPSNKGTVVPSTETPLFPSAAPTVTPPTPPAAPVASVFEAPYSPTAGLPAEAMTAAASLPTTLASHNWLHDQLGLPRLSGRTELNEAFHCFRVANDVHLKVTGTPCALSFYNMACCLAIAAEKQVHAYNAAAATRGEQPPGSLAALTATVANSGGVEAPGLAPTVSLMHPVKELVEKRVDAAMCWLKMAVAAGYKQHQHMLHDPDLKILRELRPTKFNNIAQLMHED